MNYHQLNHEVKLTVVLTCWDEMKEVEDKSPAQVLEKKLPLLLSFIKSNWADGYFNILGLSAQEFALDSAENQEKYQIEGPEQFGYLVLSNGERIDDITELIDQAIL